MRLPREHGFWVMLGVVSAAAAARASLAPRSLAILFVGAALCILVAARAGRVVRRSAAAQLGSAALLPFIGFPVEVAGGVPIADAMTTAFAWVAVFLSGAMIVRGVFERAARRTARATAFDLGAFGLCTAAAGALAVLGARGGATAAGIAAIGGAGIALARPSPRQLKAVGLAFAGLSIAAAVAMVA